MLRPKQSAQTYLYMEPADMRKSINGLAALVELEMELSPALEILFVFCNRGRDKIKLLYYPQTYVDSYAKVAHCKLYTTKTPITAADLLNDRVLPFYASHELPVLRILTDRGTEYCGKLEQHDYQLYLSVNEIEHTKTKARHPQTNGICERFHKTILQEFYQPSLRRKIYGSLEDLQMDLDEWLNYYNNERTHQGKKCCGRTPVQTLEDGKKIWMEKFVN
ncbi:IS66 family insertion sequence element accessory protein TnpB [uncultured Microbulbifer sp.]|uniref:IS66 family insertion sequence element accessory protein TnpB n=1 Tax=uncultured Microbulbifer sp. TaxID=348147 RepID=UPI0026171A69|nr:IS66 family insertion sequence element accessory protein TnpB [uncultured Microbulbifer sp.]